MGGIYGCGSKEVYRFPHTCICSFLQQHCNNYIYLYIILRARPYVIL